ncbi:helix-turn-helix domain-containing protein [Anaeromicrobium sediminis]|uniref:MerR family transcriptional regulator n=1 Tax=Anaeromicrobium sediminis TaxID=1478221 RepID=A0A267MKC9_9FIRM|nr:helix-turn-helix domain-containing protein [Anaeromicrobium sediminis]PAB60044.1 MerR family transcriptional regulator [Anaeromicrobium sediminis]
MEDINIGEKILEYRKAKSLTIRDLAKMVEVTPSLLSQIERGLANPSINTLKAISKALDVPLFTFFMNSVNRDNLVVRADSRKKIIFPENKNFAYELLSPDLNTTIEFILMTLTPGSHSSEELMAHKGEEAAYVMEGKVTLYLNDDPILLNEGDSVRILPNMKHKWENTYDKVTKVVFAVTPPAF